MTNEFKRFLQIISPSEVREKRNHNPNDRASCAGFSHSCDNSQSTILNTVIKSALPSGISDKTITYTVDKTLDAVTTNIPETTITATSTIINDASTETTIVTKTLDSCSVGQLAVLPTILTSSDMDSSTECSGSYNTASTAAATAAPVLIFGLLAGSIITIIFSYIYSYIYKSEYKALKKIITRINKDIKGIAGRRAAYKIRISENGTSELLGKLSELKEYDQAVEYLKDNSLSGKIKTLFSGLKRRSRYNPSSTTTQPERVVVNVAPKVVHFTPKPVRSAPAAPTAKVLRPVRSAPASPAINRIKANYTLKDSTAKGISKPTKSSLDNKRPSAKKTKNQVSSVQKLRSVFEK